MTGWGLATMSSEKTEKLTRKVFYRRRRGTFLINNIIFLMRITDHAEDLAITIFGEFAE